MSVTFGGLGQTGYFSKWSMEGFEFIRWRGQAWPKNERKEIYEQLKAVAFKTLYPTLRPFTPHHFTFSLLCLAVGSMFSITAFASELVTDQLICRKVCALKA